MQSETNEALARQLEASGQYKVLRRIIPPDAGFRPESGTKIGIVLDVETTGLDSGRDEVIELAMIKFAYSADDRILGVVDVFQALQEPARETILFPRDAARRTGPWLVHEDRPKPLCELSIERDRYPMSGVHGIGPLLDQSLSIGSSVNNGSQLAAAAL